MCMRVRVCACVCVRVRACVCVESRKKGTMMKKRDRFVPVFFYTTEHVKSQPLCQSHICKKINICIDLLKVFNC